ncbi:MAG: flagellar basal body L-ring protein FlgH [Deltaproteobacteria bacterium]|nr:flagellar basal body L-ring protein FlgH [Deltaproteobacteria bacterium]
MALAGIVLALAGCSHTQHLQGMKELPQPKPVEFAAPTAIPDGPVTAGSLWNDYQDDLYSDSRAHRVGDILTVSIYEKASATKEATTSTGRSSSMSAGINKLFGLEENIGNINQFIDPTKLVDASISNSFEGSGTTVRKEDLVATLTTQVVEVLPNGNLVIAGRKKVTVNREDQFIQLTGIVRPSDISAANVVDSQDVLDAEIAYTGKGVLSDKQGQGWLVWILDTVWPF